MKAAEAHRSSESSGECILKCKEASCFFKFPQKDILRSLWLYKLGLPKQEINPNDRVCDRHFSSKMMSFNKTLVELAVPDQNLSQDFLSAKAQTEKKLPTVSNFKEIQESLRTSKRIKRKKCEVQSKEVQTPTQDSTLAQPSPLPANFSTKNWITDSSNLLMDYQLRVQGKTVCDVIEIPEYVVVCTVSIPKPVRNFSYVKEKRGRKPKPLQNLPAVSEIIEIEDDEDPAVPITTPNDSEIQPQAGPPPEMQQVPPQVQQPELQQVPPQVQQPELHQVPPQVQQPELQPVAKPILESEPVLPPLPIEIPQQEPSLELPPEIDYVYYMTDDANPRRDRAVQCDEPVGFKDTAIQCDIKLEYDIMEMAHNTQLYLLEKSNQLFQNNIPMHECLDCGEIITNYVTKIKHALGHQAISSLCAQCGETFTNHLQLKFHEKEFHPEQSKDIKKKALRCPKLRCNKAFHSTEHLYKHIEEQHIKSSQHTCQKCLRSFRSSIKLICHQRALDNCLRTRGIQSKRYTRKNKNCLVK